MTYNKYIGNRYTPKYCGEHDKTKQYESLSVVSSEGNSYTSNKIVPVGIEITNTEFWVRSADYNAQVAQYGEDVANYTNLAIGYKQEVELARKGKASLNDEIGFIQSQISQNGENVKNNGASSSSSDNKQAFLDTIQYNKNVVIPSESFDIASELMINSSVTMMGKNNNKIRCLSSSSNGDININSDSIELNGLNIEGSSTNQCVYFNTSKNVKIKNNTIDSQKHGIHINVPNVEDVDIIGNDVKASAYGILTNGLSTNSKNINIAFNKVYSDSADAIELNNPSTTDNVSWKNAKVIGNTIGVTGTTGGNGSGFGIGIAKTRNVSVVGNIVDGARREGVHIEDDQENVVLTGNVVTGCSTDGIRVSKGGFTGTGKSQPVIVSNNHFVKKDLLKTDVGIYRTYDASGSLECNFSNNRINGFDVGIWLDGQVKSIVQGCIIENCNYGLKLGYDTCSIGTTYMNNCDTLVYGGSNTTCEKVYSKTKPTNVLLFSGTSGNVGTTLKGFNYPIPQFTTVSNTNKIDLFKIPTKFSGTLRCSCRNGLAYIYISSDVVWDGTTLTLTNTITDNGANLASPTFVVNNTNIALQLFDGTGNTTISTLQVDFDGVFYQK